MSNQMRHFGRHQRGISLLVVLVLLLIMTLLGLAILRGTILEERMAGNMFDRSLSFQAAESALREGELLASTSPSPPALDCDEDGVCAGVCQGGVCSEPSNGVERWLDPDFNGWRQASVLTGATPAPPRGEYFIEYMGLSPTWPGCDRHVPLPPLCMTSTYRVTARSTAVDRSTVILQSNFAVQ